MRRAVLGTDLLCTVPDFLSEALVGSGGFAADPLPFERPEGPRPEIRMAWPATVDHDPAEAWLRARIAEALAPRSAPSPPEMPQASSAMRATAVPDERDLR